MMEIDELTLEMIGQRMHLTIGKKMVEAVAWAARLGYADVTCRAFVTAVIMTDNLNHREQWPEVMKKINCLKIASDIAALDEGKTITRPVE